jgi:hypothetical protein
MYYLILTMGPVDIQIMGNYMYYLMLTMGLVDVQLPEETCSFCTYLLVLEILKYRTIVLLSASTWYY